MDSDFGERAIRDCPTETDSERQVARVAGLEWSPDYTFGSLMKFGGNDWCKTCNCGYKNRSASASSVLAARVRTKICGFDDASDVRSHRCWFVRRNSVSFSLNDLLHISHVLAFVLKLVEDVRREFHTLSVGTLALISHAPAQTASFVRLSKCRACVAKDVISPVSFLFCCLTGTRKPTGVAKLLETCDASSQQFLVRRFRGPASRIGS